jgi:hypothetical protein
MSELARTAALIALFPLRYYAYLTEHPAATSRLPEAPEETCLPTSSGPVDVAA